MNTENIIIAERIEKHILSGTVVEVQKQVAPQEFVVPAYDGYSLANIPATILSLFGADAEGCAPPLPHELTEKHTDRVNKVVLLVVDAMGYNQLLSVMRDEPDLPLNELAERGTFVPLTSTFPSSTTVALSSLHTGVTPQEHGMLGYRMYLSDLGVLADMIKLSPAWEK